MKNCLLFLFLILGSAAFTQQTEQFYQTVNGDYAFKLDGKTCILYELSRYDNYVYKEWELTHAGEFKNTSDSIGIIFSNGVFAISYDYKYFRVLKLKHGKPKDRLTFLARKLDDPGKIYEGINRAYWEVLYRKTINQINSDYPLFSDYYYRNGPLVWESFDFKQALPEEFESLANRQNELIRDSLANTNMRLIALNDSIEKHMNVLTPEMLKKNFLSRPLHDYSYGMYTDEMLESVAEKRPDLFFDLAEALPNERTFIFDQVVYSRANKALKRYNTDSPIKKEYLKYKRRENWKGGLALTGAVLLETGIIGGLITGIVYLSDH
ncbi:MAG: hypothetical protein K0S23_419 [Fluviicola sp.]|jgi:hypothetical protein|uniref:hypothetical protein n=1 Tax=Fluviicola sp. TaxID=1917219 RepID=UPI00262E0FD3|nr:hypothetical protein [Fluviicola sp.]MDF3026112.1 hypothetical protein [Fluviicola sp.]